MEIDSKNKIINIYYGIFQSIAFLPAVFSFAFATLALLLINLHESEIGKGFIELFPWLFMKDASHAASVITTLLQGIITLTVFSFSMVMIVLTQASRNFIPKVLYKFTEDKYMQVVLGFYVGTIIYYIILLVNFGKEGDDLNVPDIAFLVGVMLAITDIFLFIYFIHRTTISIHAAKLAQRLFDDTLKKMKIENIEYKKDDETEWTKKENIWITYTSGRRGYLQTVQEELAEYLRKEDLVIKIEPVFGEYVVEKMPLISVNRSINEKLLRKIESRIIFYTEERIGENSSYGFEQITEIAIKALSTGLNDPGTAIICLNFLTDLLCTKIRHSSGFFKRDKKGEIRIIARDESFENLFYKSLTPLRNYGKSDGLFLEKIVRSIVKISLQDEQKKYYKLLNDNLNAVLETARTNINIQEDYKHFLKVVKENCSNGAYFELNLPGGEVTNEL